jgi:hypothetical protein
VILSHGASEVMLDQALMLMLWEEGESVESAAQAFNGPLLARVRSQYQKRLGGQWATEKVGIVGSWREDLVLLRHMVAHAGYRPNQEQAWRAFSAHEELRKYLLDRLAEKRNKYPLTAGILISEAGLRRRDAWTNKIRKIWAETDAERVIEFAVWRSDLLRRRTE